MKNFLYLLAFLFVTSNAFQAPAPQWVQPLGQDSGVIFFQGAGLSQAEAATYMVGSSFVSPTTQERISGTQGILIFKNVWVDPELPEVVLAERNPGWAHACLHPLQSLMEDRVRKSQQQSGITVTPATSSSDVYTLSAYAIDHTKVTLGQMLDVELHRQRVASFMRKFGNTPQIWHGTSRGAAVTFVAAALAHKEDPGLLKTVKLLLMEGCYGSVGSDLQAITNSKLAIACADIYLSNWYAYKKGGISPFAVLKDFPRTIPTVFITSRTDKQVPKEETDKLVSELVNAGYDNIYYLVLENSSHGNYVASNPQDALTYQSFVHALCKQLYLPYIAAYANEGQPLLSIAQQNAHALKKAAV